MREEKNIQGKKSGNNVQSVKRITSATGIQGTMSINILHRHSDRYWDDTRSTPDQQSVDCRPRDVNRVSTEVPIGYRPSIDRGRSRVWIDSRPWMLVVQEICSEKLEGKPAKFKI